MPLSFDESGLQFAWDQTSISLADECLRKYQYRMIEGWTGKVEKVDLAFGGAFATALERYYKFRALGQTSNEALIEVVRLALIETWDHEFAEVSDDEGIVGLAATRSSLRRVPGTGKPHVWLHNFKTRENLIRTIIWYVDQFENEVIEVVTLDNGRPAVEYSYSLPVDNDIIFTGHIDRLVRYADEVYVMDQKTTGSTLSSNYFEQYRTAHQFSMYTFAGQAIYNSTVKGVIVDAAQIAVGFTRFERGFSFRSEAQLAEWYDDALMVIERARQATRDNYFPMRRTSCNNYGGCEFRAICGRSPDVRQNFLNADFVRGPIWDPLERR